MTVGARRALEDADAHREHASKSARAGGSCFGFELRSPLPFTLLRKGSGQALEIRTGTVPVRADDPPLLEWLPQPDRPLHTRVYADGDGYRMWTDREGWFGIDPSSPAITTPIVDDSLRLEQRVLGIPLMLCFLHRGELPMHAAAVEIGGEALLLAAPGHFGKTTLASAFLMAGHRVLSEDIACCRLAGSASVLPGPALLRVREATHQRLAFPSTRRLRDEPDGRVRLALEGPARGTGEPVPLRGVVFLRGGRGEGRLRRVATERALPDLWSLSLKLPTDRDRARCFERTATLADAVPVWNLNRAMRFETLPALVERIVETCLAA
jgi:hypothetical protein